MADVGVLQEEVGCLNVLIGPLLVAQVFLEIVRVEHDSGAEEISEVLGLAILSTYKIFCEEPLVVPNHQCDERTS